MTLISVMINRGFPILISDRALSRAGHVEPVQLPSRNRVVDFNLYDRKNLTYSFVQKTTIVKDVLCVGFAGIITDLKKAHEDIHDFFLHRTVTEKTLHELFLEYDFAQYKESSFVFLLARPDLSQNQGIIKFFGKWQNLNHRLLGPWHNSGSGTETWCGLVEYYANLIEPLDPFAVSNIIYSVVYPCVIKFLADEKRSPDNLLDGWGGGFDIIYYYDGKFRRVDNTTYAFWQVDISSSREIKLHSIIHEFYDGRSLILRNFSRIDHQTYQINELNFLATEEKSYSMIFDSKKVVSIIIVMDGASHVKDLYVSANRESDDVILQTGEHNGLFSMGFSIEYSDQLDQALAELID